MHDPSVLVFGIRGIRLDVWHEHIDWLARAYPGYTTKVHSRTIAVWTSPWVEVPDEQ